MPRHFGPQHMHNGYAAMGGSLKRPRYSGVNSSTTVAESIAAERARAARIAKANSGKKK